VDRRGRTQIEQGGWKKGEVDFAPLLARILVGAHALKR